MTSFLSSARYTTRANRCLPRLPLGSRFPSAVCSPESPSWALLGKTTLLSILGKFIPQDERVLMIEDTAEIQLAQKNLVRFEARREQSGLPAVAIRDLLKAALRHRPDRIVLGEIRGGEAFDLLQLLNTGTRGRCPPSMQIPLSKASRGSRAAFCRAVWTSPIARLRPTSPIRSMSLSMSSAGQDTDTFPKFS